MLIDPNEIKPSCWVGEVYFGRGSFLKLKNLIELRKNNNPGRAVFFVDHFFEKNQILDLPLTSEDECYFVNTDIEPKTDGIDHFVDLLINSKKPNPSVIVGIGGGSTLDTAKAVSNLLTNHGKAEEYQGWDLVKQPGVFKIGIPTISGTGSEASRTCVMLNQKKRLKLGMNSKFTLFNQLILDPDLTKTVERSQYFFTGLDTYIHCIESLAGSYRNFFADTYSKIAIELSREVFLSHDMMSTENREKLMLASFLGGCAIANSYVGLIHPFSAGLSVVFSTHHCVGNCIVLNAMEDYYPNEYREFKEMVVRQGVDIPSGICKNSNKEDFKALFESTVIHEIPLFNALGDNFKEILSEEQVSLIFQKM